jgi:hypothetical protein
LKSEYDKDLQIIQTIKAENNMLSQKLKEVDVEIKEV